MKRVFLHIGLPKTGTTFLQTSFAGQRAALLRQGVHYPVSGTHPLFGDSGHHLLPIAFMLDRWQELELKLDRAEVTNAWDGLLAELAATPCEDVIVSSEWFAFDVYREEDIAAIRARLAGYDVRIVLVLRDVVHFANSAYSQRIRDGWVGSPVDYLTLAWPHLNWARLMARWSQVFGEAAMISLRFEDVAASDYVAGFTRAVLGRPIALAPAKRSADQRNASLSVAATQMIREINASALDPGRKDQLRNQIKHLYEAIGTTSQDSYFSADLEELLRFTCKWPAGS